MSPCDASETANGLHSYIPSWSPFIRVESSTKRKNKEERQKVDRSRPRIFLLKYSFEDPLLTRDKYRLNELANSC